MIRPFRDIYPTVANSVYIDETAVVIGDVHIGEDSSVWPCTVIRGDVNYIRIGRRTNVQDGSILHVTAPTEENTDGFPLVIGDHVTIGHGAILHACCIGDECLIGMGATVLDGAVLENRVLLAAGSLVPPGKRLEGGYLWVGSPVKKARPLSPQELSWFFQSAENYARLKDNY
jgi:carbonic anhydrase/acetyltransferase-like protein (isoleucine patch superfamily)